MAENSKIEWTHHTVNFWWGCAKVSPACAHCYAEGQAARFHPGLWGADGERRIRVTAANREATRYERQAKREGRRLRVFTNSMADFFEDRRDLDHPRMEALDTIRQTPHLDWLILTKRPEAILVHLKRVVEMVGDDDDLAVWIRAWLVGRPPVNVWLGTTVEDQDRADQRIPHLLRVPATVRFLSYEPLLGPLALRPLDDFSDNGHGRRWLGGPSRNAAASPGIDWVICGGESGPKARPMQREWARGLRDQCAAAGVPFLFKQWGEHAPNWLKDDDGREIPGTMWMDRMGKKAAGRLLDGVLHDGYPEPRP